jgi:PhnB protein
LSHVSTYLYFNRTTEAAFDFYKSVFGTEYAGMGIMRHGDVPLGEGMPAVPDDIKNLVMNVQLPIVAGHLLMGTDIYEEMGMNLTPGNNFSIVLHLDTRAEIDELYAKLAVGGTASTTPQEMFWGGYFGDLQDKFGINWTFNSDSPA